MSVVFTWMQPHIEVRWSVFSSHRTWVVWTGQLRPASQNSASKSPRGLRGTDTRETWKGGNQRTVQHTPLKYTPNEWSTLQKSEVHSKRAKYTRNEWSTLETSEVYSKRVTYTQNEWSTNRGQLWPHRLVLWWGTPFRHQSQKTAQNPHGLTRPAGWAVGTWNYTRNEWRRKLHSKRVKKKTTLETSE